MSETRHRFRATPLARQQDESKADPLSPPAMELLQKLPRVDNNPFVIVGANGGQR
jgi:hypothetical protein